MIMTVFFLNYKKNLGPEVTFDACVLDFEAAVWQSLRNALPDRAARLSLPLQPSNPSKGPGAGTAG